MSDESQNRSAAASPQAIDGRAALYGYAASRSGERHGRGVATTPTEILWLVEWAADVRRGETW